MDDMLSSVFLGYEKYDEINVGIGYSIPKQRDVFDITISTSK